VSTSSPKISVILNCYNHELYVGEAIESVLVQSFTDFELIITDNGSTDGTRAVIERYDDPRIIHKFHDTNESLSRRLNQGVAAARGEFVCILYSDDWMLPDKLARQIKLFADLPTDYGVVYCPSIGFNQQTQARWQHNYMIVDGVFMPAILRRYREGYPDISSPMLRRACFAECPWHEDLFSDGEAIHMRIGLKWKFRFDPAPTVVLRDHGGNMGKAIQKNHHPEFPMAMQADLNHFRALTCRGNAWVALRVGTRDTAWVDGQLREVLWRDPKAALHLRWIGAWLLARVPAGGRDRLNRIGRRLFGKDENAALVIDY
jgi:glycosyltransferase involved in cell wall biosynthesis